MSVGRFLIRDKSCVFGACCDFRSSQSARVFSVLLIFWSGLGLSRGDPRCGFTGFKLRQPIGFFARGALE